MAAIELVTHDRQAPRPDALCPRCLNPSLKTYTFTRLDLEGLTPVAQRDCCPDCRVWIGPRRPIKETTP